MTIKPQILKIRRPDDWHVHLRDGEMLRTVVPYTAKIFGRAVIMPNLIPPITTVKAAITYRKKIIDATPIDCNFNPLMTCYITDLLNPNEIKHGFNEGIFVAAKLYPVNTTTNSNYGVTNINSITSVLECMEKLGMPLLIHGELSNKEIDIFDREARFIETVMEPLRHNFQELKVVLEHISTKDAAEYVYDGNEFLAATITPHHLMFNRNHMLVDGIKPHLYCLPILKSNIHQQAIRKLLSSGFNRVFLGTDSAPHGKSYKEVSCGLAGCFNAPIALSSYVTIFEEINALEYLEAFCSINGPSFYGMKINEDTIELVRQEDKIIDSIKLSDDVLIPFLAGQTTKWRVGF